MTTIEKLQAIRARFVELLAIAEKRTPGEWEAADNVVCGKSIDGYYLATCDGPKTKMPEDPRNATFIAACAGAAEAGWQITIETIDWLLEIDGTHLPIAEKIIAKGDQL